MDHTMQPWTSVYIVTTYKIANKAMGMIKSIFKYMSTRSFTILHKTFIQPHLEHCMSPILEFPLLKRINTLEKVKSHKACSIYPYTQLWIQIKSTTFFILQTTKNGEAI